MVYTLVVGVGRGESNDAGDWYDPTLEPEDDPSSPFQWDAANRDHLWNEHRVTTDEAEEAVLDRYRLRADA
jgi:hypothetical protein